MTRHWMERRWLDYIICLTIPQVALIIGLMFLAKDESKKHNMFGLRIIRLSLAVMVLGSLVYYIFFTPMFGLD